MDDVDGTGPGFDPSWAPHTPDTTPPDTDPGRPPDAGPASGVGSGRWRLSRRVMLVLTVMAVVAGGLGVGLMGVQRKASMDHGLLVESCERDVQAMDSARTAFRRTVARLDRQVDTGTLTRADATLAKRWREARRVPARPAIDCDAGRDNTALRDAAGQASKAASGYRAKSRDVERVAREATTVCASYRRRTGLVLLRRHLATARGVAARAGTGALHDPYTLTRLQDTIGTAARLLGSTRPDPDEVEDVDGTLTGLTGQVESDPGYPREDTAH